MTPLVELTALPDLLSDGEGISLPPQETHPSCRPFGPRYFTNLKFFLAPLWFRYSKNMPAADKSASRFQGQQPGM